MEKFIGRYRNLVILVAVLFAQVLGLAVQVKRPADPSHPDGPSTRLIRLWVAGAFTPVEKLFVRSSLWARETWHEYIDLRDVRRQNRELRQQIEELRVQQGRLQQDAEQARRLQALLGFKEQFIQQTVAAQVIGSSGSELSRVLTLDKGSRDGVRNDMAVITPDGVVGKIVRVFPGSSQVLEIIDQSSGVGAILEKSRLQGIVKGTPDGDPVLDYIMVDEAVAPGERVLTSGGDRIFPKGLPIGSVTRVGKGHDLFHAIYLKPAADLARLEEVLIITKVEERAPAADQAESPRAADILAQRLPSVPKAADPAADKPGAHADAGKKPPPPAPPAQKPQDGPQ
ncbi:MAG TPA: rod shape-determining protein MreC [Terriglobales bacterium]|nr:rod shape-determining protein MreC [Terriglobales bacterium]